MLKRKLDNGTVVGLSLEAEREGVLLTLDSQNAEPGSPKHQMSFMLNPVEVAEFIDGMRKSFVEIYSAHGRVLTFKSPCGWMKEPVCIEISEQDECIRFPLREHEISFIRKALESMAASLLFVGTWSGEPEAL